MTHLPIDLPTDLPTYQQIYRLPSYLPTALHTDRCTYLQIHIPIYRSTGDLLTYLPNNSDTSTYLYTNLHTYLLIYRLPTDVPTYQQTYLTTHKRVNANYPNRLALRRHTKHRPEARGCRRRAPAPTRHLTLLLQRARQEISKKLIWWLQTDRLALRRQTNTDLRHDDADVGHQLPQAPYPLSFTTCSAGNFEELHFGATDRPTDRPAD